MTEVTDPFSFADAWFAQRNWAPFPFQREVWQAAASGRSGLLNAPTGSGKTLALWMPGLAAHFADPTAPAGLRVLWVTPLRALAQDLQVQLSAVVRDLDIPWEVGLRTGDTSSAQKQKQQRRLPQCLITTPESLHVLLSQKNSTALFRHLSYCVVDEWHELLGSKRGVQVELALARLRGLTSQPLRVWGISATIGNLDEARDTLLGPNRAGVLVRAGHTKRLRIETLVPDPIERFPWAGGMGLRLLPDVATVLHQSRSALVFANTRATAEIWYQKLLAAVPEWAGQMALHHSAIDGKVRRWVENALRTGDLRVVVCTSSLDLGVDFAPVETIVQIGSPKGVGRFLQRAGRSGHQPGAESVIYFVPTHSLELIEAAALRQAVADDQIEARRPPQMPLDVLAQYLVTLAVGDGFWPDQLLAEIRQTATFAHLSEADWQWALDFVRSGGQGLEAYDEFARVTVDEAGRYHVASRRVALRHRLTMGTIVSEPLLGVKLQGGGRIGQLEETFAARLQPGHTFWFAGRNLEFVRLKDLTVYVKLSRKKSGQTPRWGGSRLPLSGSLAQRIRDKIGLAAHGQLPDGEMQALQPLLALQAQWSALPQPDECLVEVLHSREGHHLVIYPFEGRATHELMATLLTYRLGQRQPQSFSFAMNDYGFELLSADPIGLTPTDWEKLLDPTNAAADLEKAVNEAELARRRFREIAIISGLVFPGYPGRPATGRHLQSSAQLVYDVLRRYDPDHRLLAQAYREVVHQQTSFAEALARVRARTPLVLAPPRLTPFAFPLVVDRLREKLSSESLADRVARMTLQLERYAAQTADQDRL